MATLAQASSSSAAVSGGYSARNLPGEIPPPVDWLRRLAGYKLAYWRLGNDLFALREQLTRTKAKLALLDPITGHRKEADLLLYQVNLEVRQTVLLKRKDRIAIRMRNRSLDRLNEQQWQWWNFMEPVYTLRPVPEYQEYWLGSTEKNSVNYRRITAAKRQRDGQLLWCLGESSLPDTVTYPVEAIGQEYAFGPKFDVNDVMMDYWWNGIIPHFKKETIK